MRINVYAMANVRGRYASLDMLYTEPDLSTTLLVNQKKVAEPLALAIRVFTVRFDRR